MVVLLMDFTVLYICKLKYYLCFRIVFIIGKNNALYKVKILHIRFKKKRLGGLSFSNIDM